MRAILALEDGTIFEGDSFGFPVTANGEICFNTSMTGYQEIITDPSYFGQLVTLTYPSAGNYGINLDDFESDKPHIKALIVEELCQEPSNWKSVQSLASYLKEHNIPGIQALDTRKLTKHLRSRGSMRACLSHELSAKQAIEQAQQAQSTQGSNYVQAVTCQHPYPGDQRIKLQSSFPKIKHQIIAFDFGIKSTILRCLRQSGFEVQVVPATTPASEVLALNPNGIFLSNGPGDPATLTDIHQQIRQLIEHKPVFGICLGHQLIAHALGAKTFKLKFGHRGVNHPVQDLRTKKIAITSQNHGFAVDPDSLPEGLEITHINLNDQTVEGLTHRHLPVFCVQYHPEGAPGPRESQNLFTQFSEIVSSKS